MFRVFYSKAMIIRIVSSSIFDWTFLISSMPRILRAGRYTRSTDDQRNRRMWMQRPDLCTDLNSTHWTTPPTPNPTDIWQFPSTGTSIYIPPAPRVEISFNSYIHSAWASHWISPVWYYHTLNPQVPLNLSYVHILTLGLNMFKTLGRCKIPVRSFRFILSFSQSLESTFCPWPYRHSPMVNK